MQPGDRVRLVGIPPGLRDEDDLQTLSLFEKCLGHIFTVIALDHVEGLPYPLIELHVGPGHEDAGEDLYQSIWVEPEYLKIELAT